MILVLRILDGDGKRVCLAASVLPIEALHADDVAPPGLRLDFAGVLAADVEIVPLAVVVPVGLSGEGVILELVAAFTFRPMSSRPVGEMPSPPAFAPDAISASRNMACYSQRQDHDVIMP